MPHRKPIPHLEEVLGITPDSTLTPDSMLEKFERMKYNLVTMLETNDEDGFARVGEALYKDAAMREPLPAAKAFAMGKRFAIAISATRQHMEATRE